MAKAILKPIYFEPGRDEEFDEQLVRLKDMLGDLVEFSDPIALGEKIGDVDAVIFPQILGEAYRRLPAFQAINVPILIVTSEFGTLAMWDWEVKSFLDSKGIKTIAPYSLEDTRNICMALNAKRELRDTTFLIFQDNPGAGFQASIFKRFYWWEEEATERIEKKFGVRIKRKSFEKLGAYAGSIPDKRAREELAKKNIPSTSLDEGKLLKAIKIYIALIEELENDPTIRGMGINCLNESHFSETTPCLAWDLLFEERGIMWACEGDTMALITEYLVHKSLNAPVIMSNIYPFLMGQAALKHERIPSFPNILAEPENHILMAHCGYLGVCPRSFAKKDGWTIKPKVLAIVDENSHVIDAQVPEGSCTLVKLDPSLEKLMVMDGALRGYVQYPGSDCLNGAVVKVNDGHALMRGAYSHHQCLMPGLWHRDLLYVADVFGLTVETV